MALASVCDVAQLLARALSDEEEALVERRLEQVERMIIRRIPDLDAKIAAEDIDEADVIDIEAEAVYRVVRNPEGIYSETDGNYSFELNREAADNSLRITVDEWRILGVSAGKMFAIVPNLVATQSSGTPFGSGG